MSVHICCWAGKLPLGNGECRWYLVNPRVLQAIWCSVGRAKGITSVLHWRCLHTKRVEEIAKDTSSQHYYKITRTLIFIFLIKTAERLTSPIDRCVKRLVQEETWHALWNSMAEECFHPYHEKNLSLNDFHMGYCVLPHMRPWLLSSSCSCCLN